MKDIERGLNGHERNTKQIKLKKRKALKNANECSGLASDSNLVCGSGKFT